MKKGCGFGLIIELIILASFCLIGYIIIKYPHETKNYVTKFYHEKVAHDNAIIIPLKEENNGIYYIDVKLNDVPMKFILDTGCSTMLISKQDADFLISHNLINQKECCNVVETIDASGQSENVIETSIEKISINSVELENVPCMISPYPEAPSLLGQAVLSKLGKVTIDYQNHCLIIYK